MPAVQRPLDDARRRAARLLTEIGRQLRDARLHHGLSQATVAAAVGISQAQLSLIEHGRYPTVRLETLARLGTAVGFDLSVKLYPAGVPLRDKAHAELLARFKRLASTTWTWAAEVPLPAPGDKRAWDRLMRGVGVAIGVDGETRPTDMQELQRRLALKKRDGGVDRLILVLPNSEWCRRLVRLNDLDAAFPVPGKVALKALAEGLDPGGDAVILI
jgi:transcriptional regulator with XRE-family HTH domain